MTDLDKDEISYVEDDDLVTQFVTWTSDAVIEMRQLVGDIPEQEVRDTEKVNRIYDLTHNIKGMGSSFDFDLLTNVGLLLCGYMKGIKADETVSRRVLESHIRTFEVILEHRIVGQGGDQGTALKRRLEAIILEESSA